MKQEGERVPSAAGFISQRPLRAVSLGSDDRSISCCSGVNRPPPGVHLQNRDSQEHLKSLVTGKQFNPISQNDDLIPSPVGSDARMAYVKFKEQKSLEIAPSPAAYQDCDGPKPNQLSVAASSMGSVAAAVYC